MEKKLKIKLSSYLLISAISFAGLILPRKAGLSVPVFVVIQFICLFFILPKRTPLFLLIPVFILALNAFISGNDIWHAANFFVALALYSLMALLANDDYETGESSKFIFDVVRNICKPFTHFGLPVQWFQESNKGQSQLMKRVLSGIAISIPCLVFLIIILSSADEIFSGHVRHFFKNSRSVISLYSLFQWAGGLAAGFYLFGLMYSTRQPHDELTVEINFEFSDLVIINMVLFSILSVYTVFAAIQFQYLFAGGGELPYGLSYTYYARRGFFELLFLSGVNIFIILLVVNMTKDEDGFGAGLTKVICCCLCLITFILLFSSFYRMWLYSADSGLTRLRLLVFGFLFFEAIGLIFTLLYIVKPQFNILAFYLVIGLTYYLLLNLVSIDSIVARSQIDRYLATGKGDLQYALNLSTDAASQISRLLDCDDSRVQAEARRFLADHSRDYERVSGWRKFNLSAEKCRIIFQREVKK